MYVFDITQTEGKDLPALTEVQGDVIGCRERLAKFVEAKREAKVREIFTQINSWVEAYRELYHRENSVEFFLFINLRFFLG